MQGHAIAPDGGPALDDDKRAAGYGGQWREQLGWGDGRVDDDGVDDGNSGHNLKPSPDISIFIDQLQALCIIF